ncbi:MAG: 3-dehydroquinate synthase [Planctomycetaceae bacterium]|nr:3-dehydroquinate synthase [Planctomycetaceae bacterium]
MNLPLTSAIPPEAAHFDVDFQVPFRHRLRFTNDVFGSDSDVLANLIEASEQRLPRIQFWLDQHVLEANPGLKEQIRSFEKKYASRFQSCGLPHIVPGGEAVKNDVHIAEHILKVINEDDLDRRSYVIVIGGGAVLDAVGFASAIAHRGIRLIRLPTTTLAQADSGIGVKNSINLFRKKNWIGTFAVPWGVINDRSLVTSLSDRDFRCGFSEAVKVSLLKDEGLFSRICQNAAAIARREEVCWPVIAESAAWHLRHITEGGDPFEMLEARPLDFGHWSAHKLETMTEFELRHGEAVAIGVAVDSVYSSFVHGFPTADAERVLQCLDDLSLLSQHPALEQTDRLFDGLEEFRQHLGGRLTLTMLNAVARPINVHEVDRDQMIRAIRAVVDRVLSGPQISIPSTPGDPDACGNRNLATTVENRPPAC